MNKNKWIRRLGKACFGIIAMILAELWTGAAAGAPVLSVQTNRSINELSTLVVGNSAAAPPLTAQWATNTFVFAYSNRAALLADGWSYVAANPNSTPRNTEITNPALGAVVDYDQTAHPGLLRIPCDVGDLWGMGPSVNNTRNSLFRALPTNWVSAQLRLSFAPLPSANYQQVHFGLYQDDDDYLEVGSAYHSDSGASMNMAIETGGVANGLPGFSVSGTLFYFQLNRDLSSGVITGQGSQDGTTWTVLGTTNQSLANPRLMIWTGSYQAPYTLGSPNCDLSSLTFVTLNSVPTVLSYLLVTPPAGASIDTNGIITWTPTEAQGPRTNVITTIVMDNGLPPGRATNSFTVVVNEVNVAPVLPALSNMTLVGQQTLVVTNTVTDADIPVNSLTYQLTSAPGGAVIDTNGVITWTPTVDQVPSTSTFTTVVTDYNPWAINSQHLSATNSFSVVVYDVKAALVLPAQTDRMVNELTAMIVTNTATFAGISVQLITNRYVFNYSNRDALFADGWSFIAATPTNINGVATNFLRNTEVTNPPANAIYNPAGPLIIPCDVGDIWASVNNAKNMLFRSLPVGWLTLKLNLSFVPTATFDQVHLTLYQDDDNYLEVGESYHTTGQVMTMNQEVAASPVFSIDISNSSTNAWFRLDHNPANGVVTGFYSLDGANWTTFTNVTPFLANPRLAIWTGGSSSPYTPGMPVMNLIQLSIVASPIYSLLSPPAGAAIDSNGIITWTPTEGQGPSTNVITTVMTDIGVPPVTSTNSFTVVVNEINVAPVLPAQANRTLAGSQTLVVINTATDSDIPANSLAYQLTAAPPGAVIDTNGVISWVPAANQVPSTNNFTTVVTDYNPWAVNSQHLSATNSFQVVVNPVLVTFRDPNLEAAVRSALGRPTGNLVNSDLSALTCLSANYRQITNLNGLEWACNLSGLYLNGNAISDLTPLLSLNQLSCLEVEGNQISDVSPLAGLTNLTSLSLGKNLIVDFSVLSNLTSLTHLSVRTGGVWDLSVLQRLTGLVSLVLSENNITDLTPLATLTNLDCLDLRWNQLTNRSPFLTGSTNLSQLYLGGNPLAGVPQLQAFQRLKLLNLDDDGICDLTPLGSLPNLTYLSLSRDPITNLLVLSQLNGLINLELRGSFISNLAFLASSRQLRYADLAFNSVTNISPLLGLTNLNSVVLSGNPILDYGDLASLTTVSNLWLFANSITNAAVVSGLSWLNHLDLQQNSITTVLPVLALSNLTGLSLSGNPINDFTNLASLSGLKVLQLDGMTNSAKVGNDVSFLAGLVNLRSLSLNQCRIYSLGSLSASTNLQDLFVSRNHLTDISVLTNLPALHNVDITLNCLDLASSAGTVISNLQFWPNKAFASLGGTGTNFTAQQVMLRYAPTNPGPSIFTGLTTDWYIYANGSSTWQVAAWEDSVPNAQITVTAASSNPGAAAIALNPLPSANGIYNLIVNGGSNSVDTRASLTLTAVDDVFMTNSMVVPVQSINGQNILALFPDTDTNLLQQIGDVSGKNATNIMNVDCLILTNLTVYGVNFGNSSVFQCLTNLAYLSTSSCSFSNLSALTNLSKLTTLYLNQTTIADLSPIAAMTHLSDLRVSGNSLSNLCVLGNITALTSLQLSNDRLIDISCLAGLTNLTYLGLSNNIITDISVLANLPLLNTVDVTYNMLDTNSLAFRSAVGSLVGQGASVQYIPQRATPVIYILTNYIVAAGWPNLVSYYVQENGVNCGTNISCGFGWTNLISALANSTLYDWIEWWAIVTPPNVAGNTNVLLWLYATNDVGLVGSNWTILTITQPMSVTNQVFSGTNLVWTTGGDAPWFGQTVKTNQSAVAAKSGAIGSLEESWLSANLVGPGVLSFWWKVSSETNSDVLTFQSAGESLAICGEVDWQQQLVSLPAGAQNVTWQYTKNYRYGTGLDAGWVSDVSFFPTTFAFQTTIGGVVLSWPGATTYQQVTGLAAPWFQSATNLAGPWTDYASSTNSPFLVVPSSSVPTRFFRLRF